MSSVSHIGFSSTSITFSIDLHQPILDVCFSVEEPTCMVNSCVSNDTTKCSIAMQQFKCLLLNGKAPFPRIMWWILASTITATLLNLVVITPQQNYGNWLLSILCRCVVDVPLSLKSMQSISVTLLVHGHLNRWRICITRGHHGLKRLCYDSLVTTAYLTCATILQKTGASHQITQISINDVISFDKRFSRLSD